MSACSIYVLLRLYRVRCKSVTFLCVIWLRSSTIWRIGNPPGMDQHFTPCSINIQDYVQDVKCYSTESILHLRKSPMSCTYVMRTLRLAATNYKKMKVG